MDSNYLQQLVEAVCRAAEDNNVGPCVESQNSDRATVPGQPGPSGTSSNPICDNSPPLSFFNNTNCFVCNGFYGPCYDDYSCYTCHAFLYPNAALKPELPTIVEDASDSDSGNEEPDYAPHDGSGDRFGLDLRRCMRLPAAVAVEPLEFELNRLSVFTSRIDEVNIELLPTEVLMHMFTYLDEISMWAIGQVCQRWREILFMFTRQDDWREFVTIRWPLLNITNYPLEQDWYELYNALMWSACCIKCVKQMACQEPTQEEENSWRRHRLRTELRAMRYDPLDGIEAKPLDALCAHWQATIEGPAGSPYEGGLFFLYIQVPSSYPLHPPNIRFITKIFHPNVSRHGDIGIDSITHNWSLALTLSKLLISIQSLLTDPFCDVCMEPEIGNMYLRNRALYEEYARMWTIKYAMHDMYTH